MPELPDLEVLKDFINSNFSGKKIIEARLNNDLFLKTNYFSPEIFNKSRLIRVSRKGKILIFEASNDFKLVFHPMTKGWIKLEDGEIFTFKFEDNSKIGIYEVEHVNLLQLFIVKKPENLRILKSMGPEPFDKKFNVDYLYSNSTKFKESIKKLLTKQKVVAGIGNAYADEILWYAKIYPFKKARELEKSDFDEIIKATKEVLSNAIEILRNIAYGNLPPFEYREHLKIHKKEGEPCPRCGAKIQARYEGDRGTFWCPVCQPEN